MISDIQLPEPTPAPPSGGGLLQRLQPLLTLVIAITAIGLALWEGAENRRHNRLTVQPRIGAEINSGRDDAGEYVRMSIESTGLGPAVINTFRIYFDGVLQESTDSATASVWQKVLDAFGTADTQINAHAIGAGYYVPPGARQVLFEARRPRPDSTAAALAETMGRLALQICYCSVYETDCEEVLLATAHITPAACVRRD